MTCASIACILHFPFLIISRCGTAMSRRAMFHFVQALEFAFCVKQAREVVTEATATQQISSAGAASSHQQMVLESTVEVCSFIASRAIQLLWNSAVCCDISIPAISLSTSLSVSLSIALLFRIYVYFHPSVFTPLPPPLLQSILKVVIFLS